MPGVQLLLFAAEWAAQDYFVGSLHLDHVGSRILRRLRTLIWNVLYHFGSYKDADRTHMDPVLFALPFYRSAEVDWSSSGPSDDSVAFDVAIGTGHCYRVEKIAQVSGKP